MKLISLPIPEKPKYLIFSDLDETYLPWNPTASSIQSIRLLENFMRENQDKFIFIWITGSIFKEIVSKIEIHKISLLPHFIACSLGTEIWYYNLLKQWHPDSEWQALVKKALFSENNVKNAISDLSNEHIYLEPQNISKRWSKYKLSYYYFANDCKTKTLNELNLIKRISINNNLSVNISRCNPKIDNFENGYDIDFIPSNFGKEYIVAYYLNKFNLTKSNTFAFGDSSNDITMLQSVGHGYLVQNATQDAKAQHKKITKEPYALGILSVLRELLEKS